VYIKFVFKLADINFLMNIFFWSAEMMMVVNFMIYWLFLMMMIYCWCLMI